VTLTLGYVGLLSRTDEDNAALAEFFGQTLGLPVDGDAAGGYAEVKVGDVSVALHRGALVEFPPLGGVLLQLGCDDVDAETEAVRGRGGDVAVEPSDTDWGTRHAYVRGPQGLLVELYQ
jgi:catechol 2,3-dioxygenase-like lactoylglutathione lyase family enzyme